MAAPELVIDRLRNAGATYAAATLERNRAVVDGHNMGMAMRDIGDLVGLSHSGVSKLISRSTAPGWVVMGVDLVGYQFLTTRGRWAESPTSFLPENTRWFANEADARAALKTAPKGSQGHPVRLVRLSDTPDGDASGQPVTANSLRVATGQIEYQLGGCLRPGHVATLVNKFGIARWRRENEGDEPESLDGVIYLDHEWGLKLEVGPR